MVQALTHGNEFSGAIALDYLFEEKVKPVKGKLTLAFANVAAFERFDFADPDRSRYIDEDYNRVWARRRRCSGRAIRPSCGARGSCGRSSTRPTTCSTCTP